MLYKLSFWVKLKCKTNINALFPSSMPHTDYFYWYLSIWEIDNSWKWHNACSNIFLDNCEYKFKKNDQQIFQKNKISKGKTIRLVLYRLKI